VRDGTQRCGRVGIGSRQSRDIVAFDDMKMTRSYKEEI
jgi:hypothetical protein